MRLLVVDDEPRLAEGLKRGLEAEGFAVDVAHTGTDGLWLAREQQYAAILLDIMLPGMNGYVVCRTLRDEENWTPVLMLTAKDGEWDQVEGLDTGADDYLTKPFSFAVLLARLRALIRRGAGARPATLAVGDLTLDPASREVRRGDARDRAHDARVRRAGVPDAPRRRGRLRRPRSSTASGTSPSTATRTSSRSTSAHLRVQDRPAVRPRQHPHDPRRRVPDRRGR